MRNTCNIKNQGPDIYSPKMNSYNSLSQKARHPRPPPPPRVRTEVQSVPASSLPRMNVNTRALDRGQRAIWIRAINATWEEWSGEGCCHQEMPCTLSGTLFI
ncbi:hypothetical protein CDAR_94041 [Caerostris darwini]|uniref:Uncharacterized protein n=1 Tax=Caerostris darwini TaxID=1538125 RepID=A0AAV4NKT9_9ARAC|nr:hypothetical protein CDAR_94041 [Caerostris darwini]